MNINEIPILTFAYFNQPICCIENFLNDELRERLKMGEATISSVTKDADVVFNEFEYFKKIKAKRIESNDYSYEAFFFNPSIEPGKTIMFYSEGTPLSFEKTDYYKRARKKERLNKDILLEYCRAIGLLVENERFWKTSCKGLLFELKQ